MRASVQVSIFLALTCLAGFSPRSTAQPVTLHEQQHFTIPGYGVLDVCLRGDDLLALASRGEPNPDLEAAWALVHLRRQADDSWQFVRELAAVPFDTNEDFWSSPDLDCEGPLAAF